MKKIVFSYFAFSIFTVISLISSAEIRKSSQAAFSIVNADQQHKNEIVEIEYLQAGTGGELIDTGIYHVKTNDVHIKIWTFGTYPNRHTEMFYAATNGYYRTALHRYSQSHNFFYAGNMMYGLILCRDLPMYVPYEIDVHNEPSGYSPTKYYPGTCYATINGTQYSNGYSWDVPFVTDDTLKLFVNVAPGNRIYYFKVDNQIDLIPVRVGNVGYMFNKMDPTSGPNGNGLYGNIRSGAFVLGPDKE